MKRRDFFKKTFYTGVTAGAAIAFGDAGKLFATGSPLNQGPYDMVAVKGGDPVQMFDKAIESLGGMKNFVKRVRRSWSNQMSDGMLCRNVVPTLIPS